MKKFFKALALVLALTLVIGSIPAAAATTITPIEKKTLYVGGSKGLDNNGKQSSYKSRVTYAKMLGITKKEAKKLKVKAVTSDKTIVAVNNKTRAARAYGIGTATITLTANKKDYVVTITSKKSADKILFGQDWANLSEGDTFEAELNKEYVISVPRSQASKKTDTDERDLRCDDESVSIKPFLDENGKEVARKYIVTFTKAGEFKVTAGAYQSKKSYPAFHTTRTVTVTVKGLGFWAEATKVKEITVHGDGFADGTSKFTVTRGQGTSVPVTKTVIKDASTAILTLDTKITKDSYTVKQDSTENTYSFKGETHTVDQIIILDDGLKVFYGKDGAEVYVHFQVKDNYGENAHKDFSLNWYTSGTSQTVDTTDDDMGTVTLKFAKGKEVKPGNIVYATATYVKTAKTATAQMTVGSQVAVDDFVIKGIVNLEKEVAVADNKIPRNFKANQYGVYFSLLDANGHALKYSKEFAKQIAVTTPDLIKINLDDEVKGVTIGGKEYGYLAISPADKADEGGIIRLTFIAKNTGNTHDVEVEIVEGKILNNFEITGSAQTIAEDDEVELYYTATSVENENLTMYRDIAPYLSISASGLKLTEKADGTAKLTYKNTDRKASIDMDDMDVLSLLVNQGANVTIHQIDIKDAKYGQKIKSLEGGKKTNLVLGDSVEISVTKADNSTYFTFYDQYSETIEKLDPHPGATKYNYSVVSWFEGETDKISDSSNAIVFVKDDGKGNSSKFTIKGTKVSADVVSGTGISFSKKIVFALYDNTEKAIVGDSEFTVEFFAWAIQDIPRFKLNVNTWGGYGTILPVNGTQEYITNPNGATVDPKEYRVGLEVKGTTNTGVEVSIPDSYVYYERNKIVFPNLKFGAYKNGFGASQISKTTNDITNDGWSTAYWGSISYFSGLDTLTNIGDLNDSSDETTTQSPFANYGSKEADGSFTRKAVPVGFTAYISICSGGSIIAPSNTGYAAQRKASGSIELWNKGVTYDTIETKSSDWWQPYIQSFDADKKSATISAYAGKITRDGLLEIIKGMKDNYGHVWADSSAKVTVIVPKESDEGLHSKVIDDKAFDMTVKSGVASVGIKKAASVVTNVSDIVISNAEIGDEFSVIYEAYGKTLEVAFKVVNDQTAYITKGVEAGAWR